MRNIVKAQRSQHHFFIFNATLVRSGAIISRPPQFSAENSCGTVPGMLNTFPSDGIGLFSHHRPGLNNPRPISFNQFLKLPKEVSLILMRWTLETSTADSRSFYTRARVTKAKV